MSFIACGGNHEGQDGTPIFLLRFPKNSFGSISGLLSAMISLPAVIFVPAMDSLQCTFSGFLSLR